MKKIAVATLLVLAATNACAMTDVELSEWLSREKSQNKPTEQILADAHKLVSEGTMTEAEYAMVAESLGA
ncbi:MAG: hypothetical protein M1549_03065 [Candidatus Dependentiae bacterium]|nr:hypothetical protein [Candidatus Dependentiae bacterium]